MGVRLIEEYSDELKKKIGEYEQFFDMDFPDYNFIYKGKPEKEIIAIINECLEKKKNVYDLGYCSIFDNTQF